MKKTLGNRNTLRVKDRISTFLKERGPFS